METKSAPVEQGDSTVTPLAGRRGPGVRRRELGRYDYAEVAQNLSVTETTLPVHDVAYVEHGRGHARAEWALNRDNHWIVRAQADYVAERLAAGEATLEVVTRRGRTQTVTITSVGKPFTSERGGNRLAQVHVAEGGPSRPKRTRKAAAAPRPAPIPAGAEPCDACGLPRRVLLPATDRYGTPGIVCVPCEAADAAATVLFGGPLEQGELDLPDAA